ncbi:hypothetical protein F2Q68_00015103 [Brassica cretica]|uniref:Uncharacterized protein n=1 Tax=Brassica cretica TaxID=69181 RepID=A0A8S9HL27_BRACR|nr:hypothetical protein F2Q68_00015103 [Brassica cretica]
MTGSPSFKGIESSESSENWHELSNTREKGSLRKPITPSEVSSAVFTPASRPASTHQYICSSSGNIRAPGSTTSKTPSEAQSFSISDKKPAVQ